MHKGFIAPSPQELSSKDACVRTLKGRLDKLLIVAGLAIFAGAIFFLPIVPVKVQSFCIMCPGAPVIREQGYSSVALYFSDYGGIYMTADLPNFPVPTFVGYCVAYGSADNTSCGVGVAILRT